MESTNGYSEQVNRLRRAIEVADAVIIGAGAGMSASAGLTYLGERFYRNFADFISKYHFADMYSAAFYPFNSLEDYWAYMSRHIHVNRYAQPVGKPYHKLLETMKGKDYFVITTNVDHQFQKAGFDKKRLFYTQGDYGLWQCSLPCHQKTYDNEKAVGEMLNQQKNLRIPSELIPHCPECGKPMSMNLRSDHTFVQDDGWYQAAERYEDFIHKHKKSKTLYFELGVGGNTPVIIKYPFWQMTAGNRNATYACINFGEAVCPKELQNQAICINADIGQVFDSLAYANGDVCLDFAFVTGKELPEFVLRPRFQFRY